MSNLAFRESNLLPIPQVILTPRAFYQAQALSFRGIEPNADGMAAIQELTEVSHMPDITIMRSHARTRSQWDQTYVDADDKYNYVSAEALAYASPHPKSYITKADIRHLAAATGKVILDLTVKDWGNLGSALAEAIEEAKSQASGMWSFTQVGSRAIDALGGVFGKNILGSRGASPAQQRIKRAASLQPYHFIRGVDSAD